MNDPMQFVGPARVRVKVCGLTTAENALACADAGADWIGLNFHPPSPRYVDPDRAAEVAAALAGRGTVAVGLFVNRSPGDVRATASRVGLSVVQLHGDEPPEDLLALSGLCVVKAFRLGDAVAVGAMADYLDRVARLGRVPDAVLVDGHVAGLAGGTGRTIDPSLFDKVLALNLPRLILAGGLTPENVGGRVGSVRPWMVDVASGVESSPGVKDSGRVAAFVRAALGSGDAPSSQPP